MSDKNIDNRRITFLLAYGDEGRVDVMFSPEKTSMLMFGWYY